MDVEEYKASITDNSGVHGTRLWTVAAFTLAYLVAALLISIVRGNLEFLFYIAVMLVLIGTVWVVHRYVGLNGAVLWGLSVWGLAHMARHPGAARTGNAEEDRLLADIAGRNDSGGVELLIRAGADLTATGLDHGTPLHQAAWFGQPDNGRLLIDAGAPLDVFDVTHESSPIGWAAHGSRYSGGAEERQGMYVALAQMLLAAGSSLHYPDHPGDNVYFQRLLQDASLQVREVLERGIHA